MGLDADPLYQLTEGLATDSAALFSSAASRYGSKQHRDPFDTRHTDAFLGLKEPRKDPLRDDKLFECSKYLASDRSRPAGAATGSSINHLLGGPLSCSTTDRALLADRFERLDRHDRLDRFQLRSDPLLLAGARDPLIRSSSPLLNKLNSTVPVTLPSATPAYTSSYLNNNNTAAAKQPIADKSFYSSHPFDTTSFSATHRLKGADSFLGPSDKPNHLLACEPLGSSGHAMASAATQKPGPQQQAGHSILQQLFEDMRQIEDTVDSLEIPARGRCRVYMAKYGYDPFKQSPNENPDAELAFNAGDYIMVFDDVDEDGYFIGELIDGRRGYVPSNWLDRLTGDDLLEFQANTLYKQSATGAGKDGDPDNASYPPEFYDAILSDTKAHSNFQHLLAPEHYHRMNDYVDLDDVNEVDDECLSDYERAEAEQMRRAVPPPQRLVVERQLNKSILIGWLHPFATKGTIVSYQVYVDGVLKSTVPSGDRTKALLEGVDSTIPHRISVRAIDIEGRHSNDAGCTIVIGQKIPFAPSCVRASHITSDSALISWLPANSNFHHVVAVNSVEVQTVRPGVYKHLINGLSANTLYRVWVRAKPGKILSIDEKNPKKLEFLTTYVDFTTLPKSLPDPPVNVQVETGPQRRTLLVTWLPLTLNDFGTSNGCPITGYAVFAGHKKLADIDSPTGDHALLDINDLESLHKKSVTVRTKSGENLSQDSMPCHIPDEYLKSNNYHHQPATGTGKERVTHSASGNRHRTVQQSRGGGGGDTSDGPRRYSNQYNMSVNQLPANRQQTGRSSSRYSTLHRTGRHMTRSLQNLESDIELRHSGSIGGNEGSRDFSGSEQINQTESFSEEEFESSMRLRSMGRPKTAQNRTNPRYRNMRHTNSVDGGSFAHNNRYNNNNNRQLNRGTPANERDIRYFWAMFDYDPSTMSPNPNAASEELAFKEGSIIKVIGDKGPDGFYRGELDNFVGYVPCNVVSEITDPEFLFMLQQQEQASKNARQGLIIQAPATGVSLVAANQMQQQQQQLLVDAQHGVKRMVALYDYDPQENSPNADTESEIPFKTGDVIYVHGEMESDGFYMGEVERTKQRGLVPSNFLREEPLPVSQNPKPLNMMGPGQGVQLAGTGFRPTNEQQPGVLLNQFPGLNPGVNQMSVNQKPMDAAMQQQQQQMNKLAQQNQIRPMMMQGGSHQAQMLQNPQQQQQQQLLQNINRPNSLNLSNNPTMNNDWTNNNNNNFRAPLSTVSGGNQLLMQPNQIQHQQAIQQANGMFAANQQASGGMMQQPGMVNLQQQQQPNQQNSSGATNSGGMLSNLLSSGKQIIGAATTPRAPNQPNQFSSAGTQQQPGGLASGNLMSGGQSLLDAGGGYSAMSNSFSQQQQPAGFNPAAGTGAGLAAQPPSQNSFPTTGMPQQQQQRLNQFQNQQQQQPYFQMSANTRGPMNLMGGGGEEQGGNILSTVKNMFKL